MCVKIFLNNKVWVFVNIKNMRNSVKSHSNTEHAAQRQGKQAGADIVIQVCGMLRIGERSFRWLSP